MKKILIVDDEDAVRLTLSEHMKAGGFSPVLASNGKEAIKKFKNEKPHSVLLDLNMPGMNGLETLEELRKSDPDIPVVMLTAYGDIQSAVKAIKLGAYEFLIKPPDFERLVLTLKRATEKMELSKKVKTLSNEVEASLEYLCGKSARMKNVIEKIFQIAQSDFSLIIQGETGTGKSFIARYIHNLSKRNKNQFVCVDIGSIPETLVESELFGHEKGAFTGALKRKKGFFETAHEGTMLIDELQNLTPYVQSKLLMAIDQKTIFPLGSTRPVISDVRLIGTTNTDIATSIKKNEFREDLFYRFSEFMIFLPPLRERIEDIPFLAEKFFMEAVEDLDKKIQGISDKALNKLSNHSWPGNIRELKNVIRRAVFLSEEDELGTQHIEFSNVSDSIPTDKTNMSFLNESSGLDLKKLEKAAIKRALTLSDGNKTKAATLLNISYMTLFRKIKHYNI